MDEPADRAGLYAGHGYLAVVLNRGESWRLGMYIDKGSYPGLRAAALEQLQRGVREVVPWLRIGFTCSATGGR